MLRWRLRAFRTQIYGSNGVKWNKFLLHVYALIVSFHLIIFCG